MAVGLWLSFEGATEEQYNAVNAEMDAEGNPPQGLIFHAAGPADAGWNVIDFWESREAFDRFQKERLGPALVAIGDKAPPNPPSIKEFPVHNTISG